MNVKTLQKRFILIATGTIAVMLLLSLLVVNIMNYRRSWRRILKTMDFIAENNGVIPDRSEEEPGFSTTPEFFFQTRYFSAVFAADGSVMQTNGEHIAAISTEEAVASAGKVLKSSLKSGTLRYNGVDYAYEKKASADGSVIVILMDINSEMENIESVMQSSTLFGIISVFAFCIIITILSRRAVKPFEENMEKQKQFITNAGHELKTPIAIISANTEAMELLNGENEWTKKIMKQVARLDRLVSELISLAKSEEKIETVLTDVDCSAVVKTAADDFGIVALQQGKKLSSEIGREIRIRSDEKLLKELVNILTDNAVKYCDAKGCISLSLKRRSKNKGALLEIANDCAAGKEIDFERLSDRFYRGDASHNSGRPGFGIGLSMAQSIAEKLHGRISAGYSDGRVIFTVTL